MIARWSGQYSETVYHPDSTYHVAECAITSGGHNDVDFMIYVRVKYRFPLAHTKMNGYWEVVDV